MVKSSDFSDIRNEMQGEGIAAKGGDATQASNDESMTAQISPQPSGDESGYLRALLQGSWSIPPKLQGNLTTQDYTEYPGTDVAHCAEFVDDGFEDGPFGDGFDDSGPTFGDGIFTDAPFDDLGFLDHIDSGFNDFNDRSS